MHCTPVWFMRQAGRSLPEYRAARGEGSILSAIVDASLAAELTLQPVRRYGVDAAILFSDIVVPLHAIGFGVEVEAGRGPVVAEPFRGPADLARLRAFEPEGDAPYVAEAAGLVAQELRGSGVALIGFAGAPFTVASYMVEGGPSRTFARVKALMHGAPGLWEQLCDRLAAMAVASLRARRFRQGRRWYSSSTAGRGLCRPTNTRGLRCRPYGRWWRAWPTWARRSSSSGWGPASCSG